MAQCHRLSAAAAVISPGNARILPDPGRTAREDALYLDLTPARSLLTIVDPFEKKPLFHFCPIRAPFSVATAGAIFKCPVLPELGDIQKASGRGSVVDLEPQELAQKAREGPSDIAYTYI